MIKFEKKSGSLKQTEKQNKKQPSGGEKGIGEKSENADPTNSNKETPANKKNER